MAGWVDMELDDEAQLDGIPIAGAQGHPVLPRYPYGLKICLCDGEIAKLGLEDEVDAGDYLVFKARACVTSASQSSPAAACSTAQKITGSCWGSFSVKRTARSRAVKRAT